VVTVLVTSVNDPPVADDQSVTAVENSGTPVTLTASDADGDTLSYTVTSGPDHGALTGIAPNLTYTPATGYNGPDAFTFQVADGNGGVDTATVSINVVPFNDPPVAQDRFVTTPEDTPVGVTLVGTDPEGAPLTFTVTSQPANGTLTGTAPNLTYTPGPNFNGFDTFTFAVDDGQAGDTGSVSIAVLAVNDPPVADAQAVTTAEDTATAITLTGSDADGDSLSFQVTGVPAHGTLAGSGATLTYSPASNYVGPDAFTFRVRDPSGAQSTATVSIDVTPVNDPPVARDATVSTSEDTALGLTLAGTDPDGDTLAFSVVTGPAHGTLAGTGASRTYTPTPNFHGIDTLTFAVDDGHGGTDTGTVRIAVLAVNDPPTAAGDAVTLVEDTPTPIVLAANDLDGDPLTWAIEVAPAHGTLTGTAPDLTYTPTTNYVGTDGFTFSVRDPHGASSTATVSITVVAAPLIATALDAEPVVAQVEGLRVRYPRLTAVLTRRDTNGPLAGRLVRFVVQGSTVCTAFTDGTGRATCGGSSNTALLATTYEARFGGDADFAPSSGTGRIVR
jgi:hypothetical protein